MCDDEDDCCNIIPGPQGAVGFQGRIAMRGWQGEIGYQADIVIIGNQGPQGIVGTSTTGFRGVTGVQGDAIRGTQGPDGLIGFASANGPQGVSGGRGPQGAQGVSEIGAQGSQGMENMGIAGQLGIQGMVDPGPQGFPGSVMPPIATMLFNENTYVEPAEFGTVVMPSAVVGPGTYLVICDMTVWHATADGTLTFQLGSSDQSVAVHFGTDEIGNRVHLQMFASPIAPSVPIGPIVYKQPGDPAGLSIIANTSLIVFKIG